MSICVFNIQDDSTPIYSDHFADNSGDKVDNRRFHSIASFSRSFVITSRWVAGPEN